MEITRNVTVETGWDWHKIAADLRAGTSPLQSWDELDVGLGRKVVFGRDESGRAFFTFKDAIGMSEFGSSAVWETSTIRRKLNENFLRTLPDDLIKEIQLYKSTQTVDDVEYTTGDYLFLLSGTQVFGWDDDDDDPNESQIDIFKDRRNRIKTYEGTERFWWLRSADGNGGACYVTSNGYLSGNYTNYTGAVCPSFCLESNI